MGAGRSGTTALATFLGNHGEITTLGELEQFYEHLAGTVSDENKQQLFETDFWQQVITRLPDEHHVNATAIAELTNQLEAHRKIPALLLKTVRTNPQQNYLQYHVEFLQKAADKASTKYILDSSKYIARLLHLRQSSCLNIKVIYMVRDLRGVIWSFKKKVQTPAPPIRTVLYYMLINFFGEIVYRLLPKGQVLKVRYEDLMERPIATFSSIGRLLDLDLTSVDEKIKNNEPFELPAFVGGNRIVTNDKLYFEKDVMWQEKGSFLFKASYFLLSLPLMLINKYKLRGS